MRLDAYMVQNSLATGRDSAKELISSEMVLVNKKVVTKPSFDITETDEVTLLLSETFVGRGAKKLKKALEVFMIDLGGKIAIDAGASTGGFTEVMLKNGAKKVYAVDVGKDQLAKSLREDERVINLEKTDIRTLRIEDEAEFFTADVSFISLTQILYPLYNLTSENATGVCLIKPQFEAGRKGIGKKGIVKDKKVHEEVLRKIISYSMSIGFSVSGLTHSPVTGGSGNIEYLIYLKKNGENTDFNTKEVILKAWEELK